MPSEESGSVYGIYLKEMIRMRKPVLKDLYNRLRRIPFISGALIDEDIDELLFIVEAIGIEAERPRTREEFYRLKGRVVRKILDEMKELEPQPQATERLDRMIGLLEELKERVEVKEVGAEDVS